MVWHPLKRTSGGVKALPRSIHRKMSVVEAIMVALKARGMNENSSNPNKQLSKILHMID